MADDRKGKMLILFICAGLALSYPLLNVADKKELLWGFPKLYLYLFGVWALIIVLIKQILNKE